MISTQARLEKAGAMIFKIFLGSHMTNDTAASCNVTILIAKQNRRPQAPVFEAAAKVIQFGKDKSSSIALRKRAASPPVAARWSKVTDSGMRRCTSIPPITATTS